MDGVRRGAYDALMRCNVGLGWMIAGTLAAGCSGGEDPGMTGFTSVTMTMTNSTPPVDTGDIGTSGEPPATTGVAPTSGGASMSGTSGEPGTTEPVATSTGATTTDGTTTVEPGTSTTSGTSTGPDDTTGGESSSSGDDTTGAPVMCGDAMVGGAEQCDDGNKVNTDACLDTCMTAKCGDAFVQAMVEACDGNLVPNGACAADCKLACNANFGDCNAQAGDGCEASLQADNANCGKCGNACAANTKCTNGQCVGVANEHGPEHVFSGLTSNHYITQGCCSVNCTDNPAVQADYFCKHFYGNNCAPKPGYVVAQTPFPTYPKMHKRDGCTSNGLDIANTTCDGGPCKIGDWNETTTGLTNLVCTCN